MLKFKTVDFDSQLQRTIAKTGVKFAEVGECLAVADRIADGDIQDWYREWRNLAAGLEETADRCRDAGHLVSARTLYARASEYYRQSFFFHRTDLDCGQLQNGWAKHRSTFREFAKMHGFPFEAVKIPYQGKFMLGYVFLASRDSRPGPVLMAPSGYDGTCEEMMALAGIEALERGYHVMLFDGPGQGGTLYDPKLRLFMRPDFEVPLTAAMDFALKREEFDKKQIAVMGVSFGGYLVPRGASSEHRMAAMVVDPGQYDMGAGLKAKLPADLMDKVHDDSPETNAMFDKLVETPEGAMLFGPRMTAHGITSVRAYVADMLRFTSEGRADKIACKTLICDNETDVVSTGQGRMLADQLTCEYDFVTFTDAEGAGGHCEGMGREIFFQRAFDWLDETFDH